MKYDQNSFFSKSCLMVALGLSVLITATSASAALPVVDSDKISFASGDASLLNDARMSGRGGSGGGTNNSVNADAIQTMNLSSDKNSVTAFGNMTNGAITVGNNFGGSGFGSYVMNTGNNATISSGVNLSISMMPQTATP